jgi:SNF2 family DNA or RNA helicase
MDMPLDYVVLDESQAIKNPASKVTKAACLLRAKHRLCMSGTPLQNNTFDIFAQMNFLNPGMLGSIEFFRQEFAIPIDKFGEPTARTTCANYYTHLSCAEPRNRLRVTFLKKRRRSCFVKWKKSSVGIRCVPE